MRCSAFAAGRAGYTRNCDAVFIAQPDRSVSLPTSKRLPKCWEDVHIESFRVKTQLYGVVRRHANGSPEEFERNPTRNDWLSPGPTNPRLDIIWANELAQPKAP